MSEAILTSTTIADVRPAISQQRSIAKHLLCGCRHCTEQFLCHTCIRHTRGCSPQQGRGKTVSTGSVKEDVSRPSHSGCIHESVRLEECRGSFLSGERSYEHEILPPYLWDILRRICLQYTPR